MKALITQQARVEPGHAPWAHRCTRVSVLSRKLASGNCYTHAPAPVQHGALPPAIDATAWV